MDNLLLRVLFLIVGFGTVSGFNLETQNPKSFSQDPETQFGYRVTQIHGSPKWMLVSAPLTKDANQNQTGAIYQCKYGDPTCSRINTPFPNGAKNMGLSQTTGSLQGQKIVGCVPRFSFECYSNTYINGYCDILSPASRVTARVPAKLPECPRVLIDIAFLIDGSGSVHWDDFSKMKQFITAIMQKFRNKDTQIALAQFSSNPRTEFTFTEYNHAMVKEDLVNRIHQKGGGTKTPTGMKYVVDHLFTASSGARDDAKRFMITITDGLSYESDFGYAIRAANDKSIERYAVGVGNAFNDASARAQLHKIASKSENVFQVNNFAALDKIQQELQNKIFAIEGTGGSGALSSFELEMSQEGFSSAIVRERLVLGAVGAYDWSGGLVEHRSGVRKFINLTATANADVKNAYLGYTVKGARKGHEYFYVTGAPRYGHKGKVFIFSQSYPQRPRHFIDGEQIGSYFGSEICPVDLNQDGQTDLLLVGAPMYHSLEHGGIVYVYRMERRGSVKRVSSLSGVPGEPVGRFGMAIAMVTDLNGDGLADVAIGAPLEESHRGAVYIYHGTQDQIHLQHSQRVRSSDLQSGLRYFGQSVDGSLDVSGDGLTDVTVGAQGKVVILRSRPVLDVIITMTFVPKNIMLKDVDCPKDKEGPKVNAKICFAIRQVTKSIAVTPSINLTYELQLDPRRRIERAELKSDVKGSFLLRNSQCLHPRIDVKNCLMDFLNPIEILVKYTGVGQRSGDNPSPVLQSGQNGNYTGMLPFEKACGEDNICKDHLVVLFNIVGAQFIVVGSYSTLTLEVTLENTDENSYFAKVTYKVPTGLTFRKSSIISASRMSNIECDDSKNSKFSTIGIVLCRVNHPILRTGTRVHFNTTFDVASDVAWKSSAVITVNASSDNEQRITTDSFRSKTVGVKYEVNVIIKGIESTQYINFTTNDAGEKDVLHTYKVENVGPHSLPIDVTFQVPFQIGQGLSWGNLAVNTSDEAHCNETIATSRTQWQTIHAFNKSQGCNASICRLFVCRISQLSHNGRAVFSVMGRLRWSNPTHALAQDVTLMTYGAVGYDESKYIHVSQATNHFQQATVTTQVEIVKEVNMLPIIIGSSIGGLLLLGLVAGGLYKVGFFKRGYKDKLAEGADDDGPGGVPTDASAPDSATG